MNTCKKFLVLGIALINLNSYNIAHSSENPINSMHKELIVGGSLTISKLDTEVNSLIKVENSEYDSTVNDSELASLSFGTNPENREENYKAHTIDLGQNAVIEQTNTGHIHIYDKANAKDGSIIQASTYNESHVDGPNLVNGKPVTKIIDNGTSAGFDIHGDKDGNGGYLKFEKGSKVLLSFKDGEDQTKYPALYLCNDNSRVNIADILPIIDENNPNKTVDTKVHLVGTSNENSERNGTVDIFNDGGDPTSNDFVNKLEEEMNKMGNNDVIAENTKINIPSWEMKIVTDDPDTGGKKDADNQEIIVTSLESATEEGKDTEGNPVYNTANGTDIISGAKIKLVDEDDNVTEFVSGNLLEILKNNYLKNKEGDTTYTYVVKKDGSDTGIKIKPQITDLNDLNEISKVFVPSSDKTVSELDVTNNDKRATILEFIKSIAPTGDETDEDKQLKLNVYKKADEEGKKYHIYNVYLNDRSYTLDLDKFSNEEGNIVPLIMEDPVGEIPYMDMTSLKDYKDADGNPNTVLPIYTNIKGESAKSWKLPSVNDEDNQFNEIDFFGNNTKFKQFIYLMEGNFDSYINKIVFDKDSYIKTERIKENKSKPIAWEFIDSNSNVNQDSNLYASNIIHHLDLMNLKHDKDTNMTVTIDNTNNKSKFNSYIYSDEVSKDKASDSNKDTSLIVSKNATLRLLSKTKSNDPNNRFVPRNVVIQHVDSSARNVITSFNPLLDSIVQYYPTSSFIKATVPIEQQIQGYNANEHPSVELHISIPKGEFENVISFPEGYNSNTVNLDLTIVTDTNTPNNLKRLQFYNMMEYVYDSNYDGDTPSLISGGKEDPTDEDKTNYNAHFVSKNNPHLFIPLYRYHDDNINYYFLTNFEIFPEYSKEQLFTNFRNATTQDHIKLQNIIPNIYIDSTKKQFEENYKTTFGSTKPMHDKVKYVVYESQD